MYILFSRFLGSFFNIFIFIVISVIFILISVLILFLLIFFHSLILFSSPKAVIDAGNKNRTTHATESNDESSRSHAICQITLYDTSKNSVASTYGAVVGRYLHFYLS